MFLLSRLFNFRILDKTFNESKRAVNVCSLGRQVRFAFGNTAKLYSHGATQNAS